MQGKRIQRIQDIPVPDSQRRCTDLPWLIIWAGFVIGMLVAAGLQFNKLNLYKINFPTDSDFRSCGYDLDNYPYLYLTNPTGNDIARRVCVNQCPKAGDTTLICSPTATIQCAGPGINIYDSTASVDRLGAFCIPSDPRLLESALISYNLVNKWNFLKSLDVIKWSFLLSLGLGIVYFLIAQFAPKITIWMGMVLSGVLSIALGVILLLDRSYSFLILGSFVKFLAFGMILCGILLLGFTWWSSHQIRVCSVFVEASTRFLGQSLLTLSYIPLFVVLSVVFVGVITFQYLSFGSSKFIHINPNDIYWNGSSATLWNLFNLVEFLWGIFILRDSFNFVVSGNAVEWYFTQTTTSCLGPLSRLFTKNMGSVVVGAFLNCTLAIPELLLDLLKPADDGRCRALVQPCFCMCGALLNTCSLIRTDAYSYINLTGAPYCNSAKQCEYICHRSPVFEGSQSTIRIYRIGSHIMMISLVVLVSYYLSKLSLLNNEVSLMALVCVSFVTYCMAAYFLLVHLDAAEGIMTCFLTEHELSDENYDLLRCPQSLRQQVQQLEEMHALRLV